MSGTKLGEVRPGSGSTSRTPPRRRWSSPRGTDRGCAGRAGRSATATSAPTAIAAAMDRRRGRRSTAVIRLAAAMAPIPTMPNWPRLMFPPQPVSTTSDIATRPHTRAKLNVVTVPTRSSPSARTRATSAPTTAMAAPRPADLGQLEQVPGDRLEDAGAVPARLAGVGPGGVLAARAAATTRMTTRKVTSKMDSACTFQRIVHSAMPSPMPPTSAVGSDWKRAMTATARPGRIVVAPTSTLGDDAGERRLGDEREGGQAAGQRPHERLQAAHGHAEEQGAVLVLRGRPHGPARRRCAAGTSPARP